MAEESQDGQEKTEEPSQRKIDKSKEDGKVLTSKEAFVFTNLCAGLLVLTAFFPIAQQTTYEWADLFVFDSDLKLDDLSNIKMDYAFWFSLKLVIMAGLPIWFVTIGTQIFVGGLNWAWKGASFKGDKLNPITGIKRMFAMKALVELVKAVLKVVLLFGIGGYVIYRQLPEVLRMSDGTLASTLGNLTFLFPFLIGSLLWALLLIAAIDYWWQQYDHMKSLRMSHQDLKDEYKQTEGSPEVRSKIRQKQFEASKNASKQSEALKNVGNATAIITNPTHFAIALRYVVGEPGAPEVIAMGRGKIASEIIRLGKENSITVYRSPLLARALFFTSEIGSEISDKLYNAVAVALAYIYRIDKGEEAEEPNIDLPDDLCFNEHGQMIKKDG